MIKNFHLKKKIKYILNLRLLTILTLIFVQIILIVILLKIFEKIDLKTNIILKTISFASVISILNERENSSYKIGRIILILIFPNLGGIFYFIFLKKEKNKKINKESKTSDKIKLLKKYNFSQGKTAQYLFQENDAEIFDGTEAEYFATAEKMFKKMTEEIANAQKFIFLEYFIIKEGSLWNSILKILEEKTKEGVEVRVFYDEIGCLLTLPKNYPKILREKGIECCVFNPLQSRLNTLLNYRDHRKICIIDGNTAFTGGANLSDEYVNIVECYGHWKDTGIMLKGKGAEGLCKLFLELWDFSKGKNEDFSKYKSTHNSTTNALVQPFGDEPLQNKNIFKKTYMNIINNAKNYVYITSPYLVLDEEFSFCLQTAAQSGIDVRIITPHIADKWYVYEVSRSFYQELLEAGVKIFEYSLGFIHSKTILSDDETAIVGTANLDFRSFYLQYECGTAIYNSKVIHEIKQDFLETQEISREIKLHEESISVLKKITRKFLRLIAPLM